MLLTDRQSKILNTLVEQYVKEARPISSGLLSDAGVFDVSCPTIRNEMASMTREGYLSQPYTSAGKVPTEKAYRFFVDSLLSDSLPKRKRHSINKQRMIGDIAQDIAFRCSELVMFIDDNGETGRIGLRKVFEKPEFETRSAVISFIEEVERLEHAMETWDEIGELMSYEDRYTEGEARVNVFIGSENPFFKAKDYGMISSSMNEGFISLIGPMRMNYRRNLDLF